MSARVFQVVGDEFVGQARRTPGVLTLSQLERLLERDRLRGEVRLFVGQGLSEANLRCLQECIRRTGPSARVTFAGRC
jgi:hypothetical protein